MNQQIQLNIIPFTPVVDSLSFAFYADKQKGLAPIYWNKIVDTFPEGREPKFKNYYTDFLPAKEGGIVKEIKLVHAINFSLHYFRHIIFNYFKAIEGAIVFPNFTDDVEVWFHDTTLSNPVYKRYNSFTVKVQYNQVTTGYEMVLAYNGASKILNKSIADIDDFDTKNYNLINCNGTIYKYQYMPEDLRQNQETLFPVLSNHLIKFFLKGKQKLVKENRFPIYLNLITNFYNAYLNIPVFKSIINISTNGFYNVPSEGVYQTHSNSNLLQFKNGTNVNPGYGLTKHKPLLAYTENHVKLFFIYHRNDGPYIKTNLYDIFINGWCRKVKGNERYAAKLSNYINQPFSIDPEKRVVFENTDTIFEEVAETLKNFVWEPNTKYVAIYVSPISKTDTEHPQHNAYYKIKELLLHKEITSQVLFRDYLVKEDFYYFIPNIYVALLAKIGGIPWRLLRQKEEEIIIGVGAFRPKGASHRFLASAFCFSNEGSFEGFDCFKDDDSSMLAGAIRNAVSIFIEKNKTAKRVIIHFFKEISDKKELQPILNMLADLGQGDLPVLVVTVNKTDSKELLGFDIASEGKMPYSGSYVKVGPDKFLLFNNIRYSESAKLGAKDYHFPIKLTIESSNKDLAKDPTVIRELIDQVYQFSRMYWKSISQQNLPVTTKYPEMVAKIFPHFQNDHLPEFGKNNLWFL